MIHKTKNKHHKIILAIITIIIVATLAISPEFYENMLVSTDYSSIILILAYLPGFLILMGLFEVWLPQKFVMNHLGKHSGFKGAFYSFALGSIMPGPLYLAFPFAATLLRKKVSLFNAALFIGAWSSLKIGEEIFELQFLGLKFLLLRIAITIPFVILTSYIISRAHLVRESLR